MEIMNRRQRLAKEAETKKKKLDEPVKNRSISNDDVSNDNTEKEEVKSGAKNKLGRTRAL